MSTRLFRVGAAVMLAALLALPACKKKDDPDDPKLGLRSTRSQVALSQNYLKQVGLAMHSHHDANGFFPVGFYGPDGKTLGLSWRVAILPYIEEDHLYKQFRLNEPWDSDHNKTLIEKMPKIYAPPDTDTRGHTYLRSFSGKGALMDVTASGPIGPSQPVRGVRFADIRDGLSNTLMVVEAAESVPWTKPDELEYKPNGPLPKLGGVYRDGLNVLLCDGSTRWVKGEIPPETLKKLITTNGAERIPEDFFSN